MRFRGTRPARVVAAMGAIVLFLFAHRTADDEVAAAGQREAPPSARVATPLRLPHLDARQQPVAARPEFVADELLISFADGAVPAERSRVIAAIGATLVKSYPRIPSLVVVRLPAGVSLAAAESRLANEPEVASVERNLIYYASQVPNDPFMSELWGLVGADPTSGPEDVDMDAPEAWDELTGGNSVVLGVIDTGVDYTHPDLTDNMWRNPREIAGNGVDDDQNGWVDDVHGIDAVNQDADPMDDNGHGTHVAGTIAARGNNAAGVAGVLWQSSVAVCKFLTAEGSGELGDAIECLNYFAALKDAGVNVRAINNSWGGPRFSAQLRLAIRDLGDRNVVMVAAAGNEANSIDSFPTYPAAYDLDSIISVAAIDRDGTPAWFSNLGPIGVDVAAPGVDILSTLPNGEYGFASGTSMASPHVTGLAGLYALSDPTLTAAQIKSLVMSTGTQQAELQGRTVSGRRVRIALPFVDNDRDGMSDRWETAHQLNPANAADAARDDDADGLTNLGEYLSRTDPHLADTDHDGLSDGAEVNTHNSNPRSSDGDRDGLLDGDEVNVHHTNPMSADTDGDSLSDAEELQRWTTDPRRADTDGDGMSDGWELRFDFNPLLASDGATDSDGDGLSNSQEFSLNTSPRSADTDADGLSDREEAVVLHTNPASSDSDGDGMSDGWEIANRLNPLDFADAARDADGDGYSNIEEYRGGSNPNDPASARLARPWTTLQGGEGHIGSIPVVTNASQFAVRWQVPADAGGTRPVIDGQRVLLAYRDITRSAGLIVCFDISTGEVLWRTELVGVASVGPPTLGDGKLFVVVGRVGFGTQLIGIDIATGNIVMTSERQAPEIFASTTYREGFIYSRDGSNLTSVDARTGALVWSTPVTGDASPAWSPAVDATRVSALIGNVLWVLDRATGTIRLTSQLGCTPGLYNYLVLDGQGSAIANTSVCLTKFNLATGAIIWERHDVYDFSAPAIDVAAGMIYLTDNPGAVHAVRSSDGAIMWSWAEASIRGNLVLTSGHLFATDDEKLFAIDTVTHQTAWTWSATGPIALSDEGALLVSSAEHVLVSINVEADRDGDGLPTWWERRYGFDITSGVDAHQDPDLDGLDNLAEYSAKTNPRKSDSDDDNLSDSSELANGTRPLVADSDEDGLSDGAERLRYHTDPSTVDTDGDTIGDGDEVNQYRTDPLNRLSKPPTSVITPFASDQRNVLVALESTLAEYDTSGAVVRAPLPIPGAERLRDVVVTPSHQIAIAESPRLYRVDSVSGAIRTTLVPGWLGSGDLVTVGGYVLSPSSHGIHGVLRFDADGRYLDTVLNGTRYQTLVLGGDGYLYGRAASFSAIDRIDPATFAVVATIDGGSSIIPPDAHFVVDAAGTLSIFGSDAIMRLDRNGNALGSLPLPLQSMVDVDRDPEGDWVAGARFGDVVTLDSNFAIRTHFVAQGGSGFNAAYIAPSLRNGIDRDTDGMPDWWERWMRLDINAASDASVDVDADGLTNLDEYRYGSDANRVDTDGDGLTDAEEVRTHGSDPSRVDSDADGLSDSDEVRVHHTDPIRGDTDSDGLTDGAEVGTHHTDPLRADTDGDGIADGWEIANRLDPRDGNDGAADPDGDGLSNTREFQSDSLMRVADSDHDGLLDGEEVSTYHTSPTNPDTDGDRMYDDWELRFALDPKLATDATTDLDGDGFIAKDEFFMATDPRVAASKPVPAPWVTYRGNAGHTGFTPVAIAPASLRALWSRRVTTGDLRELSEATAVDGDVYVAHQASFSAQGLSRVSGVSGAVQWQVDLGTASHVSAPAYSRGRILEQTSGYPGNAGYFLGFNADTGAPLFQTQTDFGFGELRAPVPVGARVLGLSTEYGGTFGWRDSDGTLEWTAPTFPSSGWSPAASANTVYAFPFVPGYLGAIDIDTGQLRDVAEDSVAASQAAVDSSQILTPLGDVSTAYGLRLVNFSARAMTKRSSRDGWFSSQVAWSRGRSYTVDNGMLVCLDETSGAELWRWIPPQPITRPVLVTLNHVIASNDLETYVVDLASHLSVWTYGKGGHISLGNDGVLYISGIDGTLSAIATFPDADADRMDDRWETRAGLDATRAADAATDPDGDGLPSGMEFFRGTSPTSADTDADGLGDFAEIRERYTDPRSSDSDGDGLTDNDEVARYSTDPTVADTDKDGLSDDAEVRAGTNPTVGDSDGDGYDDKWEVDRASDANDSSKVPALLATYSESFEHGMPARWKAASGAAAGWKVALDEAIDGGWVLQSLPVRGQQVSAMQWTERFADTYLAFDARVRLNSPFGSFDVLVDGEHKLSVVGGTWQTQRVRIPEGVHTVRFEANGVYATEPPLQMDRVTLERADVDGDGLADWWERQYALDPNNAADAVFDSDGDGLTNLREFELQTSPRAADSDIDGMPDGWEVRYGFDPLSNDASGDVDSDGFSNVEEYRGGSDPGSSLSHPNSNGGGNSGNSGNGGNGGAPGGGGGAPSGGGGGGGSTDPLLFFALLCLVLKYARRRA